MGYAYSVSAGWGANFDHPGLFQISGSTKSGSTTETIQVIREEVEKMRSSEVTDQELTSAKESVANSFVFNFDRPSKTLNRILFYDYYGYPKDFINQYLAGIQRVTKADVLRVAREHLSPKDFTIVAVGNPPDFGKPLTTLGPVTPIDLTIPEPPGRRAKTVIRVFAFLLAIAPLFAETNLERGKRVIDEALAALGGDQFLHMQDRVEEGRAYSFYRERLSGLAHAKIYTRYLIRPEPPVPGLVEVRERQAFGKNQESAVLFTDGKGYDITFRGARLLADEVLERYKETTLRNVFYILRQRLGEPELTFTSRGADVLDNRSVEIVEIADAANRVVTVYFSKVSKLPVRQSTFRRDPVTNLKVEEVTLFSKFRDVGHGVMWPYDIQRQRDGEKIFEIFSESVTINQDLKDNLFTLPANLKILKPVK